MTFNARLTTIAGTGQQSIIALALPAMVMQSALTQFTASRRTVIPIFFVLVKLFQQKSQRKLGNSLIHRPRTALAIA
jgi:hypothetical protein